MYRTIVHIIGMPPINNPRCDGDNVCSIVCQRGTVQIEPWLQHAIKTQTRLAQRVPLCMASMLGTHNSAITLADGYGNLDLYFEQYLKWIKWAVCGFCCDCGDAFLVYGRGV